MDMQKISSEFFDRSIRVETLIHIGTMCVSDSWPSVAQDAFEESNEDVWQAIGIEEPHYSDADSWSEALIDARKTGYLVQFATPIPRDFYEDGFSFSWGFYTLEWIYAETLEEACVKAIAWQEEFIEKKRKEAEKEGESC